MYVPRHFGLDDQAEITAFVGQAGAADLVTFDGSGLTASLLPVLWDQSGDGHGRLLGHLAAANPQWQTARPEVPALAIVHGPQAYISPGWYPSTAEHGRTVPTWNYVSVHFTGPVTFHRDEAWLREVVTRLTGTHERHRDAPWRVDDAPAAFVTGQLRAIVGFELTVTSVQAKAKLGQNRGQADRDGAIAGLRKAGDPGSRQIADLMADLPQSAR
jgi:transcriptional regulator